MRKNNLYKNLIDSLYALHGINGEFLAELAEPIPFVPSRREGEQRALAVIPSEQLKSLRRAAQLAKARISRHRAHFANLIAEDHDDSDSNLTSWAYQDLLDLQGEQEEAVRDLAEALA
jgi:hypothetical protein